MAQYLIDEAEQVPLALLNPMEILPLLIVHRPANPHFQQFSVAADRVQRRPELMGHDRQELGLRAIRRFRLDTRRVCPRGRLIGTRARALAVKEQALDLATREHRVRDVGPVGDDTDPSAVLIAEWEVRQRDHAIVVDHARAARQSHRQFSRDEWNTRFEHGIQQGVETLAHDLGKGLEQRLPDDVAPASDQLVIGVVGHREYMVRPPIHGEKRRGLPEHFLDLRQSGFRLHALRLGGHDASLVLGGRSPLGDVHRDHEHAVHHAIGAKQRLVCEIVVVVDFPGAL